MANNTNIKTITFKELGEKLDFDPTTIRGWARKPIPHKEWDPEAINYEAINNYCLKHFSSEELKNKLGGVLGSDLIINKSAKAQSGTIIKLKASEMKVGTTYLVISHVNRFNYTLKGVCEVEGEKVYIFQDERYGEFKKTQDAYRALSEKELASERWTIRELNK